MYSLVTHNLVFRLCRITLASAMILISFSAALAQKKKQNENVIEAEPIAKLEIPVSKDESKNFQVTILDSKKIAVTTEEGSDCNVSLYDQDLRKLSSMNIKTPNERLKLVQKLNVNEKFYLLYADTRSAGFNSNMSRLNFKKFAVVMVDLANRKQTAVEGAFERTFTMENFSESNGKVVLAGTHTFSKTRQYWRLCYTFGLLYIPLIFGSLNFPNWVDIAVIDFAKKKCTIETPELGNNKNQTLLSSNFSGEKTGCIVLRKKETRKKYRTELFPVSIGNSIALKEPITLDAGEKNSILSFKVNNNSNQNRIAIGSYGSARSSLTQGFYLSEISDKKVFWETTITLEELLKKEVKKKVTEKSQSKTKKAEKNQVSGFRNSYYLFHSVMESENEYLFAAESYYPTYHTETRSSYVNGKYTTTTVYVFDGYVYDKGILFCTSKKGKLIWTNSMELPHFRTFTPNVELLSVDSKDDNILATIFKFPNNKVYKIDEAGNMEESEFNSVKIASKNEKENTVSNRALYWYDDFYLVDGYTKSKKSKSKSDKADKSSKYYIYKMEIGKELSEEEE